MGERQNGLSYLHQNCTKASGVRSKEDSFSFRHTDGCLWECGGCVLHPVPPHSQSWVYDGHKHMVLLLLLIRH